MYAGFGVLSLFWSPNLHVGLDILWRNWIIMFGGYFLGIQLNKKNIQGIFKYVLAGTFLTLIYGFFQLTGHDPVNWASGFSGRISSLMGNPNFYSGYLVAVLPVIFYFINREESKKRILFTVLALITIFFLVKTQTRSSLIAFSVEIILIFFLSENRFIKKAVIAAAVLVFLTVISSGRIRNKVYRGARLTSLSVKQRFFKWMTAVSMFKDSPLGGQGAGGVKTNYALYQYRVQKKYKVKLKGTSESQIHSEYLQILSEKGLTGFLLFILILYTGLKNTAGKKSEYSIYVFASLIGVLTDSIASFPLFIVPTGFIFFFFMGVCDENNKIIVVPGTVSIAASLVLVFIYYHLGVKSFYADHLRWKADKLKKTAPERADILYSKAHKLSPVDGQAEYRHGRLLYEMGRLDMALNALKNSIKIRHYGEVYNNIGIIYYVKGNCKKALENWQLAQKIGLPKDKDAQILERNIKILKKKIKKVP